MNVDNDFCPCKQREAQERREDAFYKLCEKLGCYAALAECVEDAVEDVSFSLDTAEKVKKSDKLLELVYLLSDGLRQLKDYVQTVS